jgi:hypothetical protein
MQLVKKFGNLEYREGNAKTKENWILRRGVWGLEVDGAGLGS